MSDAPNHVDVEKASASGDSSDVNSVGKAEYGASKEVDFEEYQHRNAGRLVVTPEYVSALSPL